MPYFEPMNPAYVTPYDPGQRLLEQFSDLELLLELRKRKRLGRVTAEETVPGRYVDQGYPLDGQIHEAYKRIAWELNKAHQPDRQPPGCKLETGRFMNGGPFLGEPRDRKVTLVLNYVVGPL